MKNLPFVKVVPIASLYSFIVAGLYLFGFWGTFHLNIFEFVVLSDIVKLVIYPLAGSLIFLVVFSAIVEVIRPDSLQPSDGANTPIGSLGRKHWYILLPLNILSLVVVVLFSDEPSKWLIVASLASLLGVFASHLKFIIKLLPNAKFRGTVLYILILSLGLSFAIGKMAALKIIEDNAEYFADTKASKISFDQEISGPISYVGYINGNYVLYANSDKRILFINGQSRELFVLKPNPKRN